MTTKKENEVVINGTIYVPKDSLKTLQPAKTMKGLKYVLIRGDRSGIFTGYLESKKDEEVILLEARRIWYWKGASSISQLAMEGVICPNECKFPIAVTKLQITDCIEVIEMTEKAKLSIQGVKVWQQ